MTPSTDSPTNDEIMTAMMVSAVTDRMASDAMGVQALVSLKMAVMVRMGINKAEAMLVAIQECDELSEELVAACYGAATRMMNEPEFGEMFAQIEERCRFGMSILDSNVATEGGSA